MPLLCLHAEYVPRLTSVLLGVKRLHCAPSRPRLPITYPLLQRICKFLQVGFFSPLMDLVIETACTIGFFAFLRCGEFTCRGTFDPSVNLCISDIQIFKDYLTVTLKVSKTDPFRKGITLSLFKTSVKNGVCPHEVIIEYLTVRRRSSTSPSDVLFITDRGVALSRTVFIDALRTVLGKLGLKPELYSGHSLRIGAATSAGSVRMEDHLIKMLGRWSSDCYRRYIQTPPGIIQQAQISLTRLS